MAQLKDTVISGDLSVTDSIHTGGINAFAVGTCSTAAATAAKVVTIEDPGWTLQKGSCIAVKFTATNTNTTPTLNVNNTGAKSIYYGEAASTTAGGTVGGTTNRYTYYVYDGTYWVWLGHSRDANDNTLVSQSGSTTASWRKVLLHYTQDASATAAVGSVTNVVYGTTGVSVQPSTNTLHANNLDSSYLKVTGTINELLTGTGTAGQAGSSTVAYKPALWTFNTGRTAAAGDMITIKIPVAGVNAGVWLSIDNGTNYYPIAVNGTARLTTHYAVNATIQLVLESGMTTALYGTTTAGAAAGAGTSNYTGLRWTVVNFYDTNSTYTVSNNLLANGTFIVANASAYRYQCFMKTDENHLSTFATSASSGTSKTMLTSAEYDPFGGFYYYTTNATVASGSAIAVSAMHYTCTGVDLRFSFNITASAFTAQKDVYLKLSPQANGKVKLASATPLTQTLPTTADGYWYMFIGRAYNGCCTNLLPWHPVLYHDGTQLREVTRELPPVTSSDNGKFLRVDGGIWKAVTVPDANGVSF